MHKIMSIRKILRSAVCAAMWRFPLVRLLASRRLAVLAYHGIPRQGADNMVDAARFERHMRFLKARFEPISPREIGEVRSAAQRIRVLVTFDDGYRNNAEVAAPILRRLGVPAVFFVASRHAQPGEYLWFSYLRALDKFFPGDGFRFRDEFWNMSPPRRSETVDRLWALLLCLEPHPAAMYKAIYEELPRLEDFVSPDAIADGYAGMTAGQAAELAADPLFAIGIHTVDHPYLSRCDPEEMGRQIRCNKDWIEGATGKPCETIAYPLGNYNAKVLACCRRLGLKTGFAVSPCLWTDPDLEIPRLGVYDPNLEILGLKVTHGRLIRRLNLPWG